jgi:8-oxo-dGTP diphosphatase
MHDVRAVDWLPLDAAVERLSRGYERAFLANVGPIALRAAAEQARRPVTKQTKPAEKRRPRRAAPRPAISQSIPGPALEPTASPADLPAMAQDGFIVTEGAAVQAEPAPVCSEEFCMVPQSDETAAPAGVVTAEPAESGAANAAPRSRRSFVGKMRDWLCRAA